MSDPQSAPTPLAREMQAELRRLALEPGSRAPQLPARMVPPVLPPPALFSPRAVAAPALLSPAPPMAVPGPSLASRSPSLPSYARIAAVILGFLLPWGPIAALALARA